MVPGVGPVTYRKILAALEEADVSLEAVCSGDMQEGGMPFPDGKLRESLDLLKRNAEDYSAVLEKIEGNEIAVITDEDEEYPERLTSFKNDSAPPVLYCFGNTDLLQMPGVAIVGTRNPDETGASLARKAAQSVVENDKTVVSGCARGIDSIAHFEALDVGGTTIGVLNHGILAKKSYAFLNEDAARSSFLLISEFPPRTIWSAATSMIRNATVCALSEEVIAVQALSRGGTMNTARITLESGKPLFTFEPIDADQKGWQGNMKLLDEGAYILPVDKDSGEPDLSPVFDPELRRKKIPRQEELF